MDAPGSEVISRDTPTSRLEPVDSGAVFVTGFTEKGSHTEPIDVYNIGQYGKKCGSRDYAPELYDWLDVFFREGGNRARIGRTVGPNPTFASATLDDGSNDSVDVEATSVGNWGASLDVVIAAGDGAGTFTITILDGDGEVLESSGDLADKTALIAWAANSEYVNITSAGIGGDPEAGTTSLSGGTDDKANATNATWEAAMNVFPSDLGPGHVLAPGRTSAQGYVDLIEAAASRNRVAFLDGEDTASDGDLKAAAATARASAGANKRFATFWGSWGIFPGIVAGTTRKVPWSAVVCGHLSEAASRGVSPNVAAAGDLGISKYAIALTQPAWDADERAELNEAGVNIAKEHRGAIKTYGFRTLADPNVDDTWLQLTNARLDMEVRARGEAIADRFVFREIDGKGWTFKEYAGELKAMLLQYWPGSLYGESPAEAFRVDVGPGVNTPETIQARQINAVILYRLAPFGERVRLEVSKVAITEAV